MMKKTLVVSQPSCKSWLQENSWTDQITRDDIEKWVDDGKEENKQILSDYDDIIDKLKNIVNHKALQ